MKEKWSRTAALRKTNGRVRSCLVGEHECQRFKKRSDWCPPVRASGKGRVGLNQLAWFGFLSPNEP